MKAYSLKALYPKPAQRFSRKVVTRASVMKYIFNKIASIPSLLELDNITEDLLKPLRYNFR